MVEKRVIGVEFLDLTWLASGKISNLTFDDMADLCCEGVVFDNENEPDTNKIIDKFPQP